MKKIWLGLLLSFSMISTPSYTSAMEYKYPFALSQSLTSAQDTEKFYTAAARIVQQQIYLIARLEQALNSPDPNKMRAVRGQLTINTYSVESFLKRQYPNFQTLCTAKGEVSQQSSLAVQLTDSQSQIYCYLYAYSQELWKLSPVIDRLLSRRGELALVRPLPLVSVQRKSDPVLSIATVQRPDLGKLATPFASREPDITSSAVPVVGITSKTAIANYVPPIQPAIGIPEEAISTLKTANQRLKAAQAAFPQNTKFINPQEDAAILDRFTYDIDPQEKQTYAQFLTLPNTGIFRVLPDLVYRHQPNTLQNRLLPSVSERYPFPTVGEVKGNFIPSLALKMIGDNFHLVHAGANYGFMIDLGDIPLEKLDDRLQAVSAPTGDFFRNYQPPKQLKALQIDRQRFLTGKDQNWSQNQILLASAKASLNHTYLVRSLQFQLPEIILNPQPISPQNSRIRQQLGQIPSSDTIIAFRAVRRRADGSYTILWRVLNQLPAPQIEDIEKYVQ
ncbi:hypothetical protein A0J48_015185 [Sphaerospermopsis aphanizomenoides BCCUSP55]|uniref:hypothetical protein n=1 Tax=Sphaerospermopsis aphanizomenoides TaxID=459663 RepID=UPI000AC21C9E|nr:hypothetical protein [Sphaerospermopsis aphanizomenoides]MBK1988865.1 hypothetical protein [Sphaerospermopsis aphanizomenoides BCCUSP55]